MRAKKDPVARGWVYLAHCSARIGQPFEQTYALFRALEAQDRAATVPHPDVRCVDTLVNTRGGR